VVVKSVRLSMARRGVKRPPASAYTRASVDPSVLDELPPEIAREVRLSLLQDPSYGGVSKKSQSLGRSKTLDHYFGPRHPKNS
jgi:hypothetical protein